MLPCEVAEAYQLTMEQKTGAKVGTQTGPDERFWNFVVKVRRLSKSRDAVEIADQ